MFEEYLKWLQYHERIISVFLVLVFGYLGYLKYNAHHLQVLQLQATQKDAELKAAQAQSAKAEQDTKAAQADRDRVVAQNQALILSLQQAIRSRDQVAANQQKADTTLSDPDLAKRWHDNVGLAPNDLTPTATGLAISHAGAVATVQKLDHTAVVEADLQDQVTINAKQAGELQVTQALADACKKESDSLKVEIGKQGAACEADKKAAVAQAKADANKHNWLWRLGAFVLGVVVERKVKI